MPQTSGFRSAKQILVVSFATQARAFLLSDRNIFYTRGGGEQRRGLMPLGLFLFLEAFTFIRTLLGVCAEIRIIKKLAEIEIFLLDV